MTERLWHRCGEGRGNPTDGTEDEAPEPSQQDAERIWPGPVSVVPPGTSSHPGESQPAQPLLQAVQWAGGEQPATANPR